MELRNIVQLIQINTPAFLTPCCFRAKINGITGIHAIGVNTALDQKLPLIPAFILDRHSESQGRFVPVRERFEFHGQAVHGRPELGPIRRVYSATLMRPTRGGSTEIARAWPGGSYRSWRNSMMSMVILQPIAALVAGVLILVVPRVLNYIVAIYLIIIGIVGLLGHG